MLKLRHKSQKRDKKDKAVLPINVDRKRTAQKALLRKDASQTNWNTDASKLTYSFPKHYAETLELPPDYENVPKVENQGLHRNFSMPEFQQAQ